jgi:putative hydrolase of the HAD superfamily
MGSDRPTTGEGAACRLPAGARPPLPVVRPDAWDVRRRRAVRRAAGRAEGQVAALLLDVGGVVIPSLFESVAVDGFPGGPLEGDRAWDAVQQGRTSEREYWQAVGARRPDLDIDALWRACSYVRHELRAALDAIAARVRLVAFTNDMEHFFGDDWQARFPELRAFDLVLEATRLGAAKPDPEAFRRAAAAVGERPERCLFVDDLAANLRGAQAVGMQTLLFDVRDPAGSVAALRRALRVPDEEPARRSFSAPRRPPAGFDAPRPSFRPGGAA